MAENRWLRSVTLPTFEGPAFYPFGSWGRGYILDAPAQTAMDTYLRWIVWVMIPFYPLSSLGQALGVDALTSAFCGWLVFCAFHAGVTLFILRDCKVATTRATPEGLLRRAVELRGHMVVESTYWCGLIVGLCAAVGAGSMLDGMERVFVVAGAIAGSAFSARRLWRVKRLDVA